MAATYGQGGIFVLDQTTPFAGAAVLPLAHEKGWKDTFIIPPGQVGRVVARFDRPGRYVWHCHILSHEDHEMMRPFFVGNIPKKKGLFRKEGYALYDPVGNPVAIGAATTVSFEIPKKLPVAYRIYDGVGNVVISSETRFYDANTESNPKHNIVINIDPLLITLPGDYMVTLYAGEFYDFTRIKVR